MPIEEGKIVFRRLGADLYSVITDVNSDRLEYVGQVRSEPDYSTQAKRRKHASKVWFARHRASRAEQGPYLSRGEAAKRLING